MNPEQIADKARKSISKFCIEECKAYCCRKGYLTLTEKEVDLVCKDKRDFLEQNEFLKKTNDDRYSLFLGNRDIACPCLKDHKCTIHTDPKRPNTCEVFPLFIVGKTIKLSSRCLAAKQGLFYPYVAQLLSLGYKLSKEDDFLLL